MARVDLERRAEIGREKRARTRAAILEAARACYADADAPSVTIESVMQRAGLAKGTFYLHFTDLDALEAALGDALIAELAERHEPARQAVAEPLARLATAVTIFLRDLAETPARARLVSHAIVALPNVAEAVQTRLRGDLANAQKGGQLAVGSVDLATRIVIGLVQQAALLSGSGKLDASAVPDFVRAILRALGCAPDDATKRADEAAHKADEFARHVSRPSGLERQAPGLPGAPSSG